jgi:hypothetical protein
MRIAIFSDTHGNDVGFGVVEADIKKQDAGVLVYLGDAILTIENGQTTLDFHRVPFDVRELIRAYRKSWRPFVEEAIAQYQK